MVYLNIFEVHSGALGTFSTLSRVFDFDWVVILKLFEVHLVLLILQRKFSILIGGLFELIQGALGTFDTKRSFCTLRVAVLYIRCFALSPNGVRTDTAPPPLPWNQNYCIIIKMFCCWHITVVWILYKQKLVIIIEDLWVLNSLYPFVQNFAL